MLCCSEYVGLVRSYRIYFFCGILAQCSAVDSGVAQSIARQEPEVPGSRVMPYTFVSPSADFRRTVVSNWRKYVPLVLVHHFRGLNLPRNRVIWLTDRPDMTIAIHRWR